MTPTEDEEVADRLERELLDAVPPDQRARWERLVALRASHAATTDRRLRLLGRIQAGLARLRELGATDAMIARAPAVVAECCDVDRVVLYRVVGPEMMAEAFHIGGDAEAEQRMLEFSRSRPVELRGQILESEMLRRRMPIIVRDAQQHPSTHKPLVRPYGTHSYVAAPIMPEGRVIGFLHADKGIRAPDDPDGVDEVDRDALWAFAEGFGYALERTQLVERLRGQADEIRDLLARTEAVVAEHLVAQVELAAAGDLGAGAARTAAALLPSQAAGDALAEHLTRRELEVLALIAAGETNAQIAERLVIADATAKSHVARILRKLGAANRVEAAGIWLRARG